MITVTDIGGSECMTDICMLKHHIPDSEWSFVCLFTDAGLMSSPERIAYVATCRECNSLRSVVSQINGEHFLLQDYEGLVPRLYFLVTRVESLGTRMQTGYAKFLLFALEFLYLNFYYSHPIQLL